MAELRRSFFCLYYLRLIACKFFRSDLDFRLIFSLDIVYLIREALELNKKTRTEKKMSRFFSIFPKTYFFSRWTAHFCKHLINN